MTNAESKSNLYISLVNSRNTIGGNLSFKKICCAQNKKLHHRKGIIFSNENQFLIRKGIT